MSEVIRDDGRTFEFTSPVVVIGSGAAGLVAALSAKEAGADVVVLERDPLPRGSTALSAGLIPAAGTRWQSEAGISDSPEAFAADVTKKAHGEPDPAIVETVTREAGPTLEWLGETYGLPFSLVDDFDYPGHSARRMHGLPTRSGEELIDALREAAEKAGIDILCEARATALFVDGTGRVTGLAYERPDGSGEEIGCGELVLACNGYGGNKALVAEHIPSLSDALYFGHEGNQGEALLWGEAIGAATRHLSGHQGHGSVAYPAGILITWATITEGGVQVNLAGERFCDESRGYSEEAAEVLKQPEGIAFTVFDERIAGIARQFEDFKRAEEIGAILTADDWAGLAEKMGVPAESFAATMEKAEATKAKGESDAFGRDFAGVPALKPPYHAVKVTGALFHTQGGLVVDDAARVLGKDGRPFANLYAAGGAACGISGAEASGYLSGNGLVTAVTLGRLAGRSAGRAAA